MTKVAPETYRTIEREVRRATEWVERAERDVRYCEKELADAWRNREQSKAHLEKLDGDLSRLTT